MPSACGFRDLNISVYMKICLNLDTLRSYTSANPGRGLLPHLMAIRQNDHFLLRALSNTLETPTIQELLESITHLPNWKIVKDDYSSRMMNIKKLLYFPEFNKTKVEADVYINFDADDMGKSNRPLISSLADLSVLKNPQKSSHGPFGRQIRRRTFQRMSKYADRIVVISELTAKDVKHFFPAAFPKVRVIYNGIHDNWFHSSEQLPIVQHPFSSEKYFIWYGHISPRKNIPNLLTGYRKFLKKVGESNPPKLLLLAGGDRESVLKDVRYLQLDQVVKVLPSQNLDQLIFLVDQSVGLIFPSFYEGFGLPVVEAMARGKDVVCSNTSALPEISGGLAYFADPADPESIAQAIQKVWSNESSEERKEHLIAWAKQFTHKKAALGYSNLIDEVTKTTDH